MDQCCAESCYLKKIRFTGHSPENLQVILASFTPGGENSMCSNTD